MKNKIFFSVIIVWISTLLAWIFSYLYHPVMVRYLDMKEFAEFESLLWVMNLLWVLTSGIALFLIKEFTKIKENKEKIIFLSIIKKIIFSISFLLFIFFTIFSLPLANFLQIENYIIIFLVLIIFLFSNFWYYYSIVFQAEKKFNTISFFNILNPILKLIFWIILIFLGFNLYWAIWWLLISQIIILVLNYFLLKNIFKSEKISENEEKILKAEMKKNFLSQKKQIFHFTFSTIILAIFMNIDIILAKNIFEASEAWIYAWISIVAKFLVFVGMSIETVYYPVFVSEKSIDKKKLLLLSWLYVLMTFWAIVFFYLFWEKILYFFKPWFESHLNLLYLLLLYCWILSLLNFLLKILVAFEKYFANYLFLIFLIIFIFIIYNFTNNSFYNFVNIFNLMIFSCLISWFLYFFLVKNEK